MANIPTGTVTFLFTDIEGSTRLWEQHPDAMRLALARHDVFLRDAIETNNGHIFKTIGDAFCAAFETPDDAVDAALAVQNNLRTSQPSTVATAAGLTLRVRVAMHTGAADEREGDYFGPSVNRVARLLAVAHGGQVLLSQSTMELVQDDLPPGVSVRDLGAHRLRDLQRPEHLFQLVHPDLPADFPPPRSLDALPHNLPQQVTSFVGRESEIAEVLELLKGPHHGDTETRRREKREKGGEAVLPRLVTLTGAGGTGKTRLALQVAADLLEGDSDGVWLVELAALSDPALVPQSVASALGVREEPGRSLTQTLVAHLKPRRLLLVLDNCEHLLSASSSLADAVLRGCPGVHVLATSREALGIVGEQTFPVPSLSVPEPTEGSRVKGQGSVRTGSTLDPRPSTLDPQPSTLLQYEAVRLFIERAVLSQPSFALTVQNAPAVAQVCRRLDGIPLAIELAAARVKTLPVEQIVRRLDDRFRLLTGGSRTALPRQQTLRAAIDWSYDLLSESERALLRCLSVFAGGWTLEAAEAICGGGMTNDQQGMSNDQCPMSNEGGRNIGHWTLDIGHSPSVGHWSLPEGDVLDVLSHLVDKSLVVYEDRGGEARYRMLETIRRYGQDRLIEAGEAEQVRRRHASFFTELAEEAEPQLTGAEQREWLDRLETEHDNLWAALEWWQADANGTAELLRLTGALWRFWSIHGHVTEGRRALEDALASAPAADPALGRCPARARALAGAGALAEDQSDYPRAAACFEESLALWRDIGDESDLAAALNNLANLAVDQGSYERAIPLYEEALALYRKTGDTRGTAMVLGNLGAVAHEQGDDARAAELVAESLPLKRALGNQYGLAISLENLGNVERNRGDHARAAALYEEALALRRELGHKQGIAMSLCNLGNAVLAQGDAATATEYLRESLSLFSELLDQRGLAECLAGLAGVAAMANRHLQAARLYGAAAALREHLDVKPTPEEQAGEARFLAAARAALGEEASQAAWSQGAAMTLQEAIASAQTDTSAERQE